MKTKRTLKLNEKLDYPVSVRLSKGLKIRLESYSKFTGISKSEVIQIALNEFLIKNSEIK